MKAIVFIYVILSCAVSHAETVKAQLVLKDQDCVLLGTDDFKAIKSAPGSKGVALCSLSLSEKGGQTICQYSDVKESTTYHYIGNESKNIMTFRSIQGNWNLFLKLQENEYITYQVFGYVFRSGLVITKQCVGVGMFVSTKEI